MSWTADEICSLFSRKDYANGMQYYKRGQVSPLELEYYQGEEWIAGEVSGTEVYHVRFQYNDSSVFMYCDCPRFAEKHICKHVAAAMIAHEKQGVKITPARSDGRASRLLQSYLYQNRQGEMLRPEKAHLEPKLHLGYYKEYPKFSFRVGFERLYVVKDVEEFVNNVLHERTTAYGKGLTLCHSLEQFDEHSQQLIAVLMDYFFQQKERSSYSYGYSSRQKHLVELKGSLFDRWFDLLRETGVERESSRNPLSLEEGSPSARVVLKRTQRAAELTVETDGRWTLFGSPQQMYAMNQDKILRCDRDFSTQLAPLIADSSDKKPMVLAFSDLPTFCSCVVPQIRERVELEDPDGLLQEYLPDECVPQFYLDYDADSGFLNLKLHFRYDELTVPYLSKYPDSIKQNQVEEQAAVQLVTRHLKPKLREEFYNVLNEDSLFTFLTEALPVFQKQGEVFLSDRLKGRKFQAAPASVGVSVSNGMLHISLDTGGFPREELEDLYQSLLKKRRYHRLADGRFMTLDGSSCETVAQLTHMLQLTPKQLAQGTAELPAFRALYVEDVLTNSEGLEVQRDRQFRAMVRQFKSVADGDYVLPEHLEPMLRSYQKTGFQWLKTLESCGFGGILADEMGLGKTVQMISFLSTASREVTGRTSLVVCPASLVFNWMDEVAKFAPQLKAVAILGNARERRSLREQNGEADLWVTSYELLRQDVEQYAPLAFYACILDEAQHIKNKSTLVSKAVKRINCQQRFIMTGTPIENRLSELWNLFDFLMPGYLFSHSSFVEKLEKPVVKSGDADAMMQLRRLVQPFLLRRLKKDVLKELPPKIEYVRRIQLSEEEQKIYHATAIQVRKNLETGEQGKLAVLAALTQLRQICCAPGLCYENYSGPDSKLEAALELCSGMVENGHQILLFSQFTSMLDRLREGLNERKISHFTLQGSTPKEKRAQLVKAFNNGEASVFLISLKAGGTGLNLTAADVVIHYDPWWNLAAQDQATDRAHRIGQLSNVQVYKLIARDTIEERILELQAKKAALLEAVGTENEGAILDMSREELLALLE